MIAMRTHVILLFLSCFLAQGALAQLKPEKAGVAVFPEPTESWFLVKTNAGSYIFDGESGEMQGLISHNWYTPAVVTNLGRKEAYLVESWYSRGVRGTREDVLTVVDMTDLTTKAEIDIPDKTATLNFRNHIALLGDQRHVVVFNMTPAQSLSIVDVVDEAFVGEISTPGCAIIMPTGESGFMMMCGDGTLQYIEIGPDGQEVDRERSKPFFNVDEDPVFDKPMKTRDGWAMVSFAGLEYEVVNQAGRMAISKPWSLLTDEDREDNWRPGGDQPFAISRELNLMYVLMHQGEADTHHEPGTEIWVFDLERRKRVGRLPLGGEGTTASHILSSRESQPKLYVFDSRRNLQIYDGLLLRHLRTIERPGRGPGVLQLLTYDD
jgi:methylamine dehydrogenase heavy chain